MICKDFRQNLFLFFSEELSELELQEFETHRNSCSNCKTSLAEYQNISKQYTEIPQYNLTDFQKENIRTNINRLEKERSITRYSKIIIAAAAILLVSITTYINSISKDEFDVMAVFKPEQIEPQTTVKSFELLQISETDESVFESISDQIEKLESPSFDVSFSFESNPQLVKIKQRINDIKNDKFFRSES